MGYLELTQTGAPRIAIDQVSGSLRLRGWERRAISAEGDRAEILEGEEGRFTVRGADDLTVRVPTDSEITLASVGGDAKITGIEGAIAIDSVGGDLVLRKIGPVTIENIGGDLHLKSAGGAVRIEHVGGDATIREVEGEVAVTAVGADLYLRDSSGPAQVERIGSDLVLSTAFVPGATYRFNVGGDIVCRIPPDQDARFRILGCDDLTVDAPDARLIEGGEHEEIVFGDGSALVELQAGGEIRLVGQDEDYPMAINVQLEEELEARLSGLEERISEQLSGLDELLAEKAEHIRRRAEREAERAFRKSERAMRQAERKMEHGKRKRGFTLTFGGGIPRPPHPPAPPPPPAEPVTDEERLVILGMVEAGKISVEEAEKLLAALEGR